MKHKDIQVQSDKKVIRGLEGVVAAETSISFVDGENGNLFYQGYNIHQLAEKVSYDEVIYLLWYGDLPTKTQLKEFREKLIPEMTIRRRQARWMVKSVPPEAHPMDVLRTSVSMLAVLDPEEHDNSEKANINKAIRITAKLPMIIAWLHRTRKGEEPAEPDLKKSLAHNFMEMFTGRKLSEEGIRMSELLFILHADHGMNASTFTARVTASTLADMYAATTSALGSLKGPLHGGANQRVMEMLEEIGEPSKAGKHIDKMLKEDKRIMGFGHRVYKVEDPRATHLRKWAKKLCEKRKRMDLYELSRKIERKVMREKHIHPNVDFYSAVVQDALGIPREYYTCMFAASRVSGWTAHIMEQHKNNRLMRPTSKYIGQYGRRFTPIERRHEPKNMEQPCERGDDVLSTD